MIGADFALGSWPVAGCAQMRSQPIAAAAIKLRQGGEKRAATALLGQLGRQEFLQSFVVRSAQRTFLNALTASESRVFSEARHCRMNADDSSHRRCKALG
jgi:hypothetical protein